MNACLCAAPAAKAFSQSPRSELTDGFHFRWLLKISTSWCRVKIACEPTALVSAGDNTWHTSDGSFTNEPVRRAGSFKWTKRAKRFGSQNSRRYDTEGKKKKDRVPVAGTPNPRQALRALQPTQCKLICSWPKNSPVQPASLRVELVFVGKRWHARCNTHVMLGMSCLDWADPH